MSTINSVVRQTVAGLAGTFVALATPLHATVLQQIVDRAVANRFEMTIVAGNPTLGGQFDRTAVLHRVRAEIVDASGRPTTGARWEMTVSVASLCAGSNTSIHSLADLNTVASEINFPRPWGMKVRAADSVFVSVRFADSTTAVADGLTVRVYFEYDATDRPATRIPVVLRAGAEQADSARSATIRGRTWEWTADSTGAIQGLMGSAIEAARKLIIVDVATGEVLWSERGGSSGAGSIFGEPTGVARPGVSVKMGQRYRLIAEFDAAAGDSAGFGGGAVRALLLPSRVMTP